MVDPVYPQLQSLMLQTVNVVCSWKIFLIQFESIFAQYAILTLDFKIRSEGLYFVLSWIQCYIHYDELDYSNRFV